MIAKWISSVGLAAMLCNASAWAQSQKPASVIQLDFKTDVQADGVPINIQPDSSLAPQLQAMVRKQVAQWRYRVGSWQGKPVGGTVSQRIVAEVVAVNTGGFALRIKHVISPGMWNSGNDPTDGKVHMAPPVYPPELVRRAVGGVLVYAYMVDAAGKANEIELVYPQNPDRDLKLLDAASREAMAKWTLPPTKVGGEPVGCRVLTPISFGVGAKGPDLSTYRANYPNVCPAGPTLLTEVAGTLL